MTEHGPAPWNRNDPQLSQLRVLVVGRGARDHALVWKLAASPLLAELHAAPGNPAMESVATRHDVRQDDFEGLVELAQRLAIDLVVVAFEDLLVAGIAERMEAAGVLCLGPTADAARVEGSKAFAKQLMRELGIPTPHSSTHTTLRSAAAAIEAAGAPVVVKADGLAAGRGAFVCSSVAEALEAAEHLLVDAVLGSAGRRVIVEQFVQGREASVMALSDGETVVPLPAVRDYKRLGDDNTGPNTGGMGACSPPPGVSPGEVAEAVSLVVRPVVEELRRRGTPYRGVLYGGVMFTDEGPLALEYNCRFGNPETQVLVRLLESDLLELLYRAATGNLAGQSVAASGKAAVGVCVAAASYPDLEFEPAPVAVQGLAEAGAAHEAVRVFVGPTDVTPEADRTAMALGGRICTVTATGESLADARAVAYAAAGHVELAGSQLRRDIGTEDRIAASR